MKIDFMTNNTYCQIRSTLDMDELFTMKAAISTSPDAFVYALGTRIIIQKDDLVRHTCKSILFQNRKHN